MSNYDYEIEGYYVQWDLVGVTYQHKKKFDIEDDAIEFARKRHSEGFNNIRVYQVRNIIEWI